jgi:hypothetical protein
MKTFGFTFILYFLCTSLLFSQNWFGGASADIRFYGQDDENLFVQKRFDGTLSPEIGYKFSNYDFGIVPTIKFNYLYYETQGSFYGEMIGWGAGIGLFSRYKFITFFDKLSVLGRLDANYAFSMTLTGSNDTGSNDIGYYPSRFDHEIGLSMSPILEYKLTDRLSLYSSIIGTIIGISYIHSSLYSSSDNYYYNDRSTDRHSFILILPSKYSFSLTNISFGFYVSF